MDTITIIGTSYFQPIADLVDKLTSKPAAPRHQGRVPHRENGYAAATVVLLVALLESFTSRIRFKRKDELKPRQGCADLLIGLFPALPTKDVLHEVFLLRNLVVHNHVWHLDESESELETAFTLATPLELGFDVNQHYRQLVDQKARKTVNLGLSATPTGVGVEEVHAVFQAVWQTLSYLHQVNYDHTPLAGRRVSFRGKLIDFEELIQHLSVKSAA